MRLFSFPGAIVDVFALQVNSVNVQTLGGVEGICSAQRGSVCVCITKVVVL